MYFGFLTLRVKGGKIRFQIEVWEVLLQSPHELFPSYSFRLNKTILFYCKSRLIFSNDAGSTGISIFDNLCYWLPLHDVSIQARGCLRKFMHIAWLASYSWRYRVSIFCVFEYHVILCLLVVYLEIVRFQHIFRDA